MARKASTPTAEGMAEKPRKQQLTLKIDADIDNRVKNAVVGLSGPPLRLTLSRFAEEAFAREVDRLEKEHNKGRAYSQREAELTGGRRVK